MSLPKETVNQVSNIDKRAYRCRRCKSHGLEAGGNGHKKVCPKKICFCSSCKVTLSTQKTSKHSIAKERFHKDAIGKKNYPEGDKINVLNVKMLQQLNDQSTQESNHVQNMVLKHRKLHMELGAMNLNEYCVNGRLDKGKIINFLAINGKFSLQFIIWIFFFNLRNIYGIFSEFIQKHLLMELLSRTQLKFLTYQLAQEPQQFPLKTFIRHFHLQQLIRLRHLKNLVVNLRTLIFLDRL